MKRLFIGGLRKIQRYLYSRKSKRDAEKNKIVDNSKQVRLSSFYLFSF